MSYVFKCGINRDTNVNPGYNKLIYNVLNLITGRVFNIL